MFLVGGLLLATGPAGFADGPCESMLENTTKIANDLTASASAALSGGSCSVKTTEDSNHIVVAIDISYSVRGKVVAKARVERVESDEQERPRARSSP